MYVNRMKTFKRFIKKTIDISFNKLSKISRFNYANLYKLLRKNKTAKRK